jgi:hypothetical protein
MKEMRLFKLRDKRLPSCESSSAFKICVDSFGHRLAVASSWMFKLVEEWESKQRLLIVITPRVI